MADATDNFNRADGNVGANWTSSFNSLDVASNTVKAHVADDCAAWWNANSFGSDHYSQVTLANYVDGGGAAVRHQSGATTFYSIYLNANLAPNPLSFYEVTAGSFAQLGAQFTVTPVNGDTWKLDATGSTLTAYRNGGSLTTRSDSSLTGGAPGIYIYSTGMALDDWLGGPITAVGDTLSPQARIMM